MTFKIIDITEKQEYEQYLYKCLAPMPYRKYRKRRQYLENAVHKGFHKKIVELSGEIVGQIEYSPAKVSGLPISGENIFVMNCIWVLRKAKGYNLGMVLLDDVILSLRKENAEGLATIGLENHPSPWLKRDQMEKLGFLVTKAIELRISHKKKYKGCTFSVYLMWFPMKKNANVPYWDVEKLSNGVIFCTAHPLYHPESVFTERIFEIVGTNKESYRK